VNEVFTNRLNSEEVASVLCVLAVATKVPSLIEASEWFLLIVWVKTGVHIVGAVDLRPFILRS
jgi:hypothetical protein